jgi:predicted metal-dependent phosphoesterase TrpH
MKIDLHIHTRTGSDVAMPVEEVLREAKNRRLTFMSITDHDSIEAQEKAVELACEYGIEYVSGIELNITFSPPGAKAVSLDFLGYGYDIKNRALLEKLRILRQHRDWRAREIMQKVNVELAGRKIEPLKDLDLLNINESVDGALGRPHIAAYLVKKGIVDSIQQAFDTYLVKCDVPKYPLSLSEASKLVRDAGGILVLAHPNDPHGTSLATISSDPVQQMKIITGNMLEYIDGIECWHPRHDRRTIDIYIDFSRKHALITTGGSDCHQKPIIMGTVRVPAAVSKQFQRG